MSDFDLQIEKIAGLADERSTCGVFVHKIGVGKHPFGTLVANFLIFDAEGDLPGHLRDVFNLVLSCFEADNEKPLEILNIAVKKAEDFAAGQGFKVNFVLTLFIKNVCFIARAGDKVKVFAYFGGKSQELKITLGSGPVASGQLYILGTEKFFNEFDTNVFENEGELDLEGIVDGLATEISADDKQGEIGVAFVYVKNHATPLSSVLLGSVGQAEDADKKNGEGVEEKQNDAEIKETEVIDSDNLEVPVGDKTQLSSVLLSSVGLEKAKEERTFIEEQAEEVIDRGGRLNVLGALGSGLHFVSRGIGAIASEFKRVRVGDIGAVGRLRRNVVLLAILALVVLGSIGFFAIKGRMDSEKRSEFESHLSIAGSKLEEAEAIVDLNREKARGIFTEADREVKSALEIFPNDEGAKLLSGRIDDRLKNSENQAEVKMETFAGAKGNISAIAKRNNNFYLFSASGVKVVDVDGKDIDSYEINASDDGFVFDNWAFGISGNKIVKVDLTTGSSVDVAQVSGSRDLAVFLGNVYILSVSQIQKFVPIERGYSESAQYLENNENFGEDSRFSIDGSVWVTSGDKIYQFTRGARDAFGVSGLKSPVKFGEIYTDGAIDNLYVLDIQNSALLVIGKDGLYKQAYQSTDFGRATDILVDEETGKLYIAVGSKVLVGTLNQ